MVIRLKFLTTSSLALTEPPPPVMASVVGVFARLLNTLKSRTKPATSKCILRSPTLASQALLAIMSGCRFGAAGFVPLLLALVLPLPLSNCEQKGPGVLEEQLPPGKVTELGTNC